MKPTGGDIFGPSETHGRRYLRAKTEISSDKDGDISGQKRRYPPAKPYNGPTDKVHIGYNSANGLIPIFTDVIVDRTNHDGKNPCDV